MMKYEQCQLATPFLQLFEVQAVHTDATRAGDKGRPTAKLLKVGLKGWTIIAGTTECVVTEPSRSIEGNIKAFRPNGNGTVDGNDGTGIGDEWLRRIIALGGANLQAGNSGREQSHHGSKKEY
jgi:hypothetical protein